MAGMKYENVNFNNILREGIHFPKTKNGNVLYTRIASFDGKDTDGDFYDKKVEKDPIYLQQSKVVYNSPTNIKRIFITGTHIYITYHTSPVDKKSSNGRISGGRHHSASIKTLNNDKNLFEIAKELLDLDQKKAAFEAERAVNPKAELTVYNVNGTGSGTTNNLIKALSAGWVASNVEEFYFDWTALLPSEVFSMLFNNIGSASNLINMFLNSQGNNKIVENDYIKNLVTKFNSGGVRDFTKRFPRLRFAAMISNLDAIYNQVEDKGDIEGYGDSHSDNVKTWFSRNKSIIEQQGGVVFCSKFDGSLQDYKTKEQQYLFDNEKLKTFFETNISKLKQVERDNRYAQTSTDTEEDIAIEVGPIESKLLQLEQELGTENFKRLLQLSITGVKVNELNEIFKVFTKPNRERYKAIIGLK